MFGGTNLENDSLGGHRIQLDAGDQFPRVTAMGLDDTEATIPDLFDGSWGVVLFYRGHW